MRKEEVKVLALQDELKEAEKEWDKAINDVMAGKGEGVLGNEYDKAEKEAREKERREKELQRKSAAKITPAPTKFNNFENRSYDMSDLERKLLQQ